MRTSRKITSIAIMAVLMIISKQIIAFLPNVELVTLLVIVYALVFGWRYMLLACTVFNLIQFILYGFGSWWLLYAIVWPLIGVISIVCKKFILINDYTFALYSALMAIVFKVVDVLVVYFLLDIPIEVRIITGASFTLVHIVFNFIIALNIGMTLYTVLFRICKDDIRKHVIDTHINRKRPKNKSAI